MHIRQQGCHLQYYFACWCREESNLDQLLESACVSESRQDAAAASAAPKLSAKPTFAKRKRPAYALPATAPLTQPAKLLKADAAPKQTTKAPPVKTTRPLAKRSTVAASAPMPDKPAPPAPRFKAKQPAAACADGAHTAAPCAIRTAQQGNADEAGAAAAAAKAPRNRTKAADLDVAAVEAKVRAKHAEQQLEKLSIPEIKCFLKVKKLPVGGKKGDLLERLVKCLAEPL